ncbi:MAG: tetratricopeptide repeat protein, partial [Planctomycetota bacterium]
MRHLPVSFQRPPRRSSVRSTVRLVAIVCLAGIVFSAGCPNRSTSQQQQQQLRTRAQAAHIESRRYFDIAINDLHRLHEFNGGEMIGRIADQLNQWLKDQEPDPKWHPDPLVEQLPDEFRQLSVVQNLGEFTFNQSDANHLLVSYWFSRIADWAGGDTLDDLSRARALFDWTIRNIQLENQQSVPVLPSGVPLVPSLTEVLLLGRGSPLDRAMVFTELCRQEHLDAGIIAVQPNTPDGVGTWQVAFVGVLIEGKIHLFDPLLGVPVPNKRGFYLNNYGLLMAETATLEEAASDSAIVRQLDIGDTWQRLPDPSVLERVAVFIPAPPLALAQRMRRIEEELTGRDRFALYIDASAVAERFAAHPRVATVGLWSYPFEMVTQRVQYPNEIAQYTQARLQMLQLVLGDVAPLWRGRQLYFQGKLVGEDGAASFFQRARLSERQMSAMRLRPEEYAMFQHMKVTAAYWLGQIAMEQGNFDSAVEIFQNHILAQQQGIEWLSGVIFHLGRIAQLQRNYAQAVDWYQRDTFLPSRYGSLLRASKLVELASPPPQESPEEPTAEPDTQIDEGAGEGNAS